MTIFTRQFKKTITLSFLGHLSVFFIFSFSFGPRIGQGSFTSIYFLQKGLFLGEVALRYKDGIRHFFVDKTAVLSLDRAQKPALEVESAYLKPNVEAPFELSRYQFKGPAAQLSPVLKKTGAAIIFHPQIPYSLAPYFKDRQGVHIEIMFNIVQMGEASSVQIRRKVSSGNLEADLLSMRYISRYIFMQRQVLSPNNWQTVKIDLSAK